MSSRWGYEGVAHVLQPDGSLLEVADAVVGVVEEACPPVSEGFYDRREFARFGAGPRSVQLMNR
jgi:hypothetical protein